VNTSTLSAGTVGATHHGGDPVTASAAQEEPSVHAEAQWPRRVLLVCSSGGHLVQLVRLRTWWESRERMWVTFPGPDSESQLVGEDVSIAYHPTTRNAVNAVRNIALAVRLVRRFRPDVVVSTGAGVAFPFFIVARLLRIRTVYLEVFDRIDGPTLTGRLCYPITDLFLLQWEEQKRNYPRGRVVGSVF
jgi:UDP-N-acetylglucosamine:LPS N-acetylglucosamine transferase